MKKGLTEIVFILDRSGSMSGLEKDTIGGFNSLIERQKKEEGEAYISTVLFDNEMKVLHDRVPLNKVRPMTEEEYYVGGCTALLDAVAVLSTTSVTYINMPEKKTDRKRHSLSLPPTDRKMPASVIPTPR